MAGYAAVVHTRQPRRHSSLNVTEYRRRIFVWAISRVWPAPAGKRDAPAGFQGSPCISQRAEPMTSKICWSVKGGNFAFLAASSNAWQ